MCCALAYNAMEMEIYKGAHEGVRACQVGCVWLHAPRCVLKKCASRVCECVCVWRACTIMQCPRVACAVLDHRQSQKPLASSSCLCVLLSPWLQPLPPTHDWWRASGDDTPLSEGAQGDANPCAALLARRGRREPSSSRRERAADHLARSPRPSAPRSIAHRHRRATSRRAAARARPPRGAAIYDDDGYVGHLASDVWHERQHGHEPAVEHSDDEQRHDGLRAEERTAGGACGSGVAATASHAAGPRGQR